MEVHATSNGLTQIHEKIFLSRRLTPKEIEVIEFICEKPRIKVEEIAGKLGVSEETVRTHIYYGRKKLGCKRRGDIIQRIDELVKLEERGEQEVSTRQKPPAKRISQILVILAVAALILIVFSIIITKTNLSHIISSRQCKEFGMVQKSKELD